MEPRHPELHVITSGRQSLDEVLRVAEAAFVGGMDCLHIREKQRTARECMEWVEALARVMPRERILVNDRVDVAAAAGCRGAHLAYHSLTPSEARRVLKPGQRIGRSVHSLDEARQAAAEGADYLLYGHVFPSTSKPGLAPRGTDELREIAAQVRIPVIGIGGVTPENAGQVLAAGCAGVAVLSGITAASDPAAAARAYREALDRWKESQV
ncbi:thiamine phosphate synthase [Brevibacillus sp. WF146]|uniref:thiamine phosphate synthase n=1 Tax=Brevibacillus sp. WF146 TaxID=319501 RepID=UPI002227AB6F|nr:thiamine phosphate synthase [Brevibacillus sp. WF146]UYZ11544.1 thiamine phosphate synthase [Brevibacillus sp. WF146]